MTGDAATDLDTFDTLGKTHAALYEAERERTACFDDALRFAILLSSSNDCQAMQILFHEKLARLEDAERMQEAKLSDYKLARGEFERVHRNGGSVSRSDTT